MGGILILGATGGVGSSLARALAAKGRSLTLAARNAGDLQALAAELPGATSIACDVLQPVQVEQAVSAASSDGRLEGLAYCIGSILVKPLKSLTDQEMTDTWALNLLGAVRALRAAEKPLKAGQGAVLLYSTVAVGQGFANHVAISTAKAGIEALTRSLAAEWAPEVRVNALAPSLTRTRIAEPFFRSPAMVESLAQMHPLRRLGEPADLAHLGALLLGPETAWVTGQVIGVDGGRATLRTKG